MWALAFKALFGLCRPFLPPSFAPRRGGAVLDLGGQLAEVKTDGDQRRRPERAERQGRPAQHIRQEQRHPEEGRTEDVVAAPVDATHDKEREAAQDGREGIMQQLLPRLRGSLPPLEQPQGRQQPADEDAGPVGHEIAAPDGPELLLRRAGRQEGAAVVTPEDEQPQGKLRGAAGPVQPAGLPRPYQQATGQVPQQDDGGEQQQHGLPGAELDLTPVVLAERPGYTGDQVVPAGTDWLSAAVAAQVLGEGLGGGVAAARILFQAFQAD